MRALFTILCDTFKKFRGKLELSLLNHKMHVGTLTSSFQETWQLASKYRRIGSFLMQSAQANLRIQLLKAVVGRQYNELRRVAWSILIGNNGLLKASSGLLVASYLMLTKQCALTTASYRLR